MIKFAFLAKFFFFQVKHGKLKKLLKSIASKGILVITTEEYLSFMKKETQGQFASMSVIGGQATWVVTLGLTVGLTFCCHSFEILNL